ncbi:MAG: citrate lyase holo-[Synergistaceae bacterium]|nr:citrate lyase holo-[acyl-carrier protein] synthase [Synergistaceae bacterium]
MTGNEINLAQMLARREKRANQQEFFLTEYHSPLVSFSMNIPGPIKTNELIRRAFDIGEILLLETLRKVDAEILDFDEVHEDTGDELLLAVKNILPENLKDLAMNIENSSEIGRLFDIDIIDADGKKLSRKNFRKCLICDKQAQDCARSRTHSVSEMQEAVENILRSLR